MRSGVIVLYFPRVECALELFRYILRVWNALWHYCVIFPARGMRSGIIMLYFPHVEHALALLCYIFLRVEHDLALLCYIFRVWNALWRYCVKFSTRGTRCRTYLGSKIGAQVSPT